MVNKIRKTLQKELNPSVLEIVDESGDHAGHSGSNPGFTTHLHIHVVSDLFSTLGTLERHRFMYQILDPFLKNGLHAVRIDAFSPEETDFRNLDLNE